MCGVAGAFGDNPATMVSLSLTYLQHRGHEAASVVSTDGEVFHSFGGLGKPTVVFEKGLTAEMDQAFAAIGQNRYSTTGRSDNPFNIQPIRAEGPNGVVFGGHNGNFPDALKEERLALEKQGARFESTMDSEVLVQMVAWSPGNNWLERVSFAMEKVKNRGSFTLVLLTKDELIMARDPHGNRPACYGEFDGGWLVASEDSVLRQFRCQNVTHLKPGEVVIINKTGLTKHQGVERGIQNWCSFEGSYLSLPTSSPDGISISQIRESQGELLGKLYPIQDADAVIGVPDSGAIAGHGYARTSGIDYHQWILRDRERGQRTFIEPDSVVRRKLALMKYIIDPRVKDMRLVLVDDSIVRGLTQEVLVEGLFYFGAKSVDVMSCHPPIAYDCDYGMDISTEKGLVAQGRTREETERFLTSNLGARSVHYLSVEQNAPTQGRPFNEMCYHCSNGDPRLPIVTARNKLALEALAR